MAREIEKNLKFKKYEGKFDPKEFAKMLDDAYLATKRADGDMTKYTFSPSSFRQRQWNFDKNYYCLRNCVSLSKKYWYSSLACSNV